MPGRERSKATVDPYDIVSSEVPSEGFISDALQYLSRPGWSVGSLLMGDTEQAGQHFGALFGGDAPELGPQVTDVMSHHGMATPEKGSWTELGVNVLGGMAIDPITFFTLGAGGLAKGALVGASKKLATGSLAQALKKGTVASSFKRAKGLMPAGSKDAAIAAQAFEDTLQGTSYWRGLSGNDKALVTQKLSAGDWQSLSKDLWGSVIDEFHRTGQIEKTGMALRLDIPFTGIGMDVPGTRAMGQAATNNFIATPILNVMENIKGGFVSKFLDKSESYARGIPEGLKYTARDYMQQAKRDRTFIGEEVVKEFGDKGTKTWYNEASPTLVADLARVGATNIDEYRGILNSATAIENGSVAQHAKWQMLEDAGVGKIPPVPDEKFKSLPEIIYSRRLTENRGKWTKDIKEFAEKVNLKGVNMLQEDVVKYAANIFEDIRPKKTLIGKLISGGMIKLKHSFPPGKKLFTIDKGRWFGSRVPLSLLMPGFKYMHKVDGSYLVTPGFNTLWKNMVTSNILNAPFHFRNFLGSIVMGALNPDIGWGGLTAGLRMVGLGKQGRDFRLLHKAIHADQKIALEAAREVSRLAQQGVKVAGRPIDEFLDIAKGALGGRVSHSAMDIVSETGEAFDLLNRHGRKFAHRAVYQWGENVANYTENFMRLTALEKLLAKGYEPSAALSAVQKQFVDYSIVSDLDKVLRDYVPFIKYQLGALNWTKQVISRPRQLAWIGKVQQSEDILLESQQDPLSGEVPTALGFPGMFRYNLGSGGLSTLESWEKIRDPLGGPKSLLQDAHPIFKTAMEYGFDKDLFTNKKFSVDRKPPKWMPDWLVTMLGEVGSATGLGGGEVTRKKGITTKEIPAIVNTLIYDMSPLTRQIRMLDNLYEGKYLKAILGVNQIESIKKKADRLTIRNLTKILKKKSREGDIKEFIMYISAYDKENTPPEIKSLLKARREILKTLKREALENNREKR